MDWKAAAKNLGTQSAKAGAAKVAVSVGVAIAPYLLAAVAIILVVVIIAAALTTEGPENDPWEMPSACGQQAQQVSGPAGPAPPGQTSPGGAPSLLGPPTVSQQQAIAWWHSKYPNPKPRDPSNPAGPGTETVESLVPLYWQVGQAEGVRPDVALVQMMHETGYWSNTDSVKGNNPAGIGHYDNAAKGNYCPTENDGITAPVQLLHQIAGGKGVHLASPQKGPNWGGRQIQFWDDMGGSKPGSYATDPNYWQAMGKMWKELLDFAHAGGAQAAPPPPAGGTSPSGGGGTPGAGVTSAPAQAQPVQQQGPPPAGGPGSDIPVDTTSPDVAAPTDPAKYDPEQKQVVAAIIAVGKQRNLPPRAWQIAITAGSPEGGLHNLSGGDADSVGVFQMRPSMGEWGSAQQLRSVNWQITSFYDHLLRVQGWEQQRPGVVAQKIERSGFPERYFQFEQPAANAIQMYGNVDPGQLGGPGVAPADAASQQCAAPAGGPPGGPAPAGAPGPQAAGAMQFALSKQGLPYIWAATGPNGYDCSGLTMMSYRSVGINLPRTAAEQYHAGQHIPVQQAQPGDLMFWAHDVANPGTIHHVTMYIGNGQMMEAQQTGVPLKISPVRPKGLMPDAVRPTVAAPAPPK